MREKKVGKTISSRNATQLVINPTFGTTAANWWVKVIDGSRTSNQYDFPVQAPAAAPQINSVNPNPVKSSADRL